ncbi:MAG: phosphatidylserine/phosphatidylglycerophosphate/cardiolipin synthase family protein [Myxococcota bacterium]
MLHLRLSTWSPIAGEYVPLPNGTKVRARARDLRTVVDEAVVRRGRAALDVENLDTVEIEASLEGDALTTAGKRVRAGTPGAWTPPDPWVTRLGHRRPRGVQGTSAAPFELRFGREAFLRFVYWSEEAADFVSAPEGLVVTARDTHLPGDVILGRAVTDREGRVSLPLHEGERDPDLWFQVEPTDGADETAPLCRAWSSRDSTPLGGVDAKGRGYWADWKAQRLGSPEEPYLFAIGESPPRTHPGNQVSLLVDGPALLAAWEAAIASARHTLHLETMLYFDDPMTRRIQACILAKAREGVQVRLLLGMEMTRAVPAFVLQQIAWLKVFRRVPRKVRIAELAVLEETLAEERRRTDIDALIAELVAEPNVTVLDNSSARVEELPGIRRQLPAAYRALEGRLPAFTMMRVDHRKLLVVDGRVAVLGGQNVGREYAYERAFDPAVPDKDEEWVKWHDVSVRIAGPVVTDLQRYFRERWVGEGGETFGSDAGVADVAFPPIPPRPDGLSVRIVDTTPGARRYYHATMIALFHGARRHIHVMSPYFSNPEALGALTAAARRGVAVTFVFPYQDNDSRDYLYSARLWYPEMIEAGIAVYEYQHHMNHAKVAVVDDVAVVGTANMNHSSFFFHYELAAVVADAGFAREMTRALWEQDIPHCRRIQAAEVPGLLDITSAAEVYLRTLVQRRF